MITALLAFAWKSAAVALVVIGVARTAERFGPALAAVLMGLPLSTGPGIVLLALSQDETFVAQSALFSLAATGPNLLFLIGYVRSARLGAGLWMSLAAAYGVWGLFAPALVLLPMTVLAAGGIAAAGFVAAHFLLPRDVPGLLPSQRTPWRYLLLRGVLGGVVIASVATAATLLGPSLSGVFVAIPTVFAASAWMLSSLQDNRLAAETLGATDRGLLSYAFFCLTVHLLSGPLSALTAIFVAFAVSIAVSAIVVALSRLNYVSTNL